MKALLIASTDSYNSTLPLIGKELQKRGHKVVVIKTEVGDSHNHVFSSSDFEVTNWESFTDYAEFDIAVYGNIFNAEVRNNIVDSQIVRVGLFFHLTIDDYVLGGANIYADYTLCFGQRFVDNQERLKVSHNFLPVGVPFDETVKKNDSEIFLFLEQHFYPSGRKGKQQLADFLISVAKNTNYQVIVKPRSLENEEITHHKADHLYGYINEKPENLVLLKEHLDLHELSQKATIVATTFSTAIVPAIAMNKPILFINGFTFEETYYYNRNLIRRYYDLYKKGCNVLHYRDVLPHLNSIRPMPCHLKNALFHPRNGKFGASVAEFLEFVYDKPILSMKGRNIDNYHGTSKVYDANPFDQLNNFVLERLYRVDLISGFRMMFENNQLRAFIQLKNDSSQDIAKYENEIKCECERLIANGMDRVFNQYSRFPIGFKGLYLKYLYDNGKKLECENLPKTWHIADYYYNKYLFTRKDLNHQSVGFLKRFLRIAQRAKYRYTPLYEDEFIIKAKMLLKEQYGEVV